MDSLPDDLLMIVLSGLEAGSLLRAAAVSRRFRAAAAWLPYRAVLNKRRYAHLKPWLLRERHKVHGLTVYRFATLGHYHYRWLAALSELRSFKTVLSRCTLRFLETTLPGGLERLELDRLAPETHSSRRLHVSDILACFPNLGHLELTLTERWDVCELDGAAKNVTKVTAVGNETVVFVTTPCAVEVEGVHVVDLGSKNNTIVRRAPQRAPRFFSADYIF